jgi:hypothetical protein
MDKQCGGLKVNLTKLNAKYSQDKVHKYEYIPEMIINTVFKPVGDMINHDSSNFYLLNVDSLKGFLVFLTVDEENSNYLDIGKTQFTYPVTKFILKFVVLRGASDFNNLEPYNNIHKSFESRHSFFEEAKMQQLIWTESITGGSPPICPSVANFAIFDTLHSAQLLWGLLKKVKEEEEPDPTSFTPTSLFNYLVENSKKDGRGIGILTMPAITQSTTLDRFVKLPDNGVFYGKVITREDRLGAISNIFAQVVRLFIQIGVIHFDLHAGNVMIYLDSDKTILEPVNTLLIDFGRASNINSEVDDLLGIEDKNDAKNLQSMYFNDFFKLADSSTNDEKRNYIKSVLDTIAKADFEINQQHYRDGRSYQMMWYSHFRQYYKQRDEVLREAYANIFVKAFNILEDMMTANIDRPGITQKTIAKYERDGSFVNYKRSIDEFIVSTPGPIHPRRQVRNELIGQLEYRVQMDPPLPPVSTKRSFAQVDQSPNEDANSLPPHAQVARTEFPNATNTGGRKNKHRKINKRKKCKSKKNRRNKNKNTRKKRKIETI